MYGAYKSPHVILAESCFSFDQATAASPRLPLSFAVLRLIFHVSQQVLFLS